MKQATAAQKVQMGKLNLDQLEDLHEEMTEMMQDQEEIQEILGRDYALEGMDEAELEQELGELDEEIVNEKIEGAAIPSYVSQNSQSEVKKQNEDLNNIMNQ